MHVHAIGAGSDVVHHGCEFLSRADGFASQPIQGPVAGNRHYPSCGVVGHAVTRPCAQRFGEGLLDGVFGDGEVTGPASECRYSRTPFAPKDAVQVGH
jgi:hypothetical protein